MRAKSKVQTGERGVVSAASCLSYFVAVIYPLFPIFVIYGCGYKTPVRPPELVAPKPITNLAVAVQQGGVRLHWGRPKEYIDGSNMEDLAGFVVQRALVNGAMPEPAFTRLATVVVEDRDRFRQAKTFSYTDEQLRTHTRYRYRVQSFTLDGYYSSPSNTVEVEWKDMKNKKRRKKKEE